MSLVKLNDSDKSSAGCVVLEKPVENILNWLGFTALNEYASLFGGICKRPAVPFTLAEYLSVKSVIFPVF